jgi:hypothetical protein
MRRERNERERLARGPEKLPLTGKLKDDGIRYADWLFDGQLAICSADPFMEVQLPLPFLALEEQFCSVSDTLSELLRVNGPFIAYYIGITRHPVLRFHRRDYGYFIRGFTGMWVLWCGPPNRGAELERYLIRERRGRNGCQNVNPGGENAPPSGIGAWVYCVWAVLDDGRSLQQRAASIPDRLHVLSMNQLEVANAIIAPDMLDGRR